MNSKKRTYWKVWELNDTDYEQGTYCWVLFFTGEDFYNTPYHNGIAGSEEECMKEIKWLVATKLTEEGLL